MFSELGTSTLAKPGGPLRGMLGAGVESEVNSSPSSLLLEGSTVRNSSAVGSVAPWNHVLVRSTKPSLLRYLECVTRAAQLGGTVPSRGCGTTVKLSS